MSDSEIESILSKLKLSDLQLLDKLIDDEDDISNKKKREIFRIKTQRNEYADQNENFDVQRARLVAVKGNKSVKKHSNQKRATSHHQHHHQYMTDAERTNSRIDAKINFLRDKYKRQSACKKYFE